THFTLPFPTRRSSDLRGCRANQMSRVRAIQAAQLGPVSGRAPRPARRVSAGSPKRTKLRERSPQMNTNPTRVFQLSALAIAAFRSEEHTSELQSRVDI